MRYRFMNFYNGKRAPKLDHLNYSVLSLGDSSYEFFCHTGKQFDERLAELAENGLLNALTVTWIMTNHSRNGRAKY